MPTYFISIQSTYAGASIALFKDSVCLEKISKKDSRASSHLVPYIDDLLKNHRLSLSDLSFIAVDKGPGAFTSLRVTITTVNGIAFTHKVPLIGIDGLDALSRESGSTDAELTVSLLNAYNNDVYYKVALQNKNLDKGCTKIDTLLNQIKENYPDKKIMFTGNGTSLHNELITQTFTDNATIPKQIQETASAEMIGLMALEKFKQQNKPVYKIDPNYMKTQLFATRKPLFNK